MIIIYAIFQNAIVNYMKIMHLSQLLDAAKEAPSIKWYAHASLILARADEVYSRVYCRAQAEQLHNGNFERHKQFPRILHTIEC